MFISLLFAVLPQGSSNARVASAELHPAALTAQTYTVNLSPPALKARVVRPDWPRAYIVHRGDSLSLIARHAYGDDRKWTNIFWANKTHIRWANIILVGQHLTLPAPAAARVAPRQLGPIVAPPVRAVASVRSSGGAVSSSSTVRHATYAQAAGGTFMGTSWHEQCIIRAESGGNAQVMNSSGHYGLYQFSYSTWVGSGGSAADFGHASAGEQRQVFLNAVAARGYSDWDPYDGC
jgi:soluble lytic murein transglycosylase-like protein